MLGRTTPYTDRGIRRVLCAKCRINKAALQWSTACANGNKWVALCVECDVALNELVLKWIGDPDVRTIIVRYRQTLAGLWC